MPRRDPRSSQKLASSGFRFQTMTRREIQRVTAGKSNTDLVSLLRSRVDARTAPPGPALSWLGETIVHGEDVFRALGGYRTTRSGTWWPSSTSTRAATF